MSEEPTDQQIFTIKILFNLFILTTLITAFFVNNWMIKIGIIISTIMTILELSDNAMTIKQIKRETETNNIELEKVR